MSNFKIGDIVRVKWPNPDSRNIGPYEILSANDFYVNIRLLNENRLNTISSAPPYIVKLDCFYMFKKRYLEGKKYDPNPL